MKFDEFNGNSVVVVICEKSAQLLDFKNLLGVGGALNILGEEVIAVWPEFDWLGFYDWLRSKNGEIIGIRLRFDNIESLPTAFCERVESFLKNDTLFAIFNKDEGICENISDDADFGGNCIFIGSDKMIAISFNRPKNMTS